MAYRQWLRELFSWLFKMFVIVVLTVAILVIADQMKDGDKWLFAFLISMTLNRVWGDK